MTLRRIGALGGGGATGKVGALVSATLAPVRLLVKAALGVAVTALYRVRSVPQVAPGVRVGTRARWTGLGRLSAGARVIQVTYTLRDALPLSIINTAGTTGNVTWSGSPDAAGSRDGVTVSHTGQATGTAEAYLGADRTGGYGSGKGDMTLTKVEAVCFLEGAIQANGDSLTVYLGTPSNPFQTVLLNRTGIQTAYPAGTVLAFDVGPGSTLVAANRRLDTWTKVQDSRVTLRHSTATGSILNTLTVDYVGLRINASLTQPVQ